MLDTVLQILWTSARTLHDEETDLGDGWKNWQMNDPELENENLDEMGIRKKRKKVKTPPEVSFT